MAPIIANLERVAVIMGQASDVTRLRTMLRLWEGEAPLQSIIADIGIARACVAHHLGLLKMAGMVARRREGKACFYSLTPIGRSVIDFACHV